jgi:hypothetical protein
METKAIYMTDKMYIDASFTDLNIKTLSFNEVLADSVLYNSTSYLEEKKPEEDPLHPVRYAAKGNCTEQGLIRFFLN